MNKADEGLSLYLIEVKNHLIEYRQELDELALLPTITGRDYRAAERLLQLITEVSIGLAKHWLKSCNKTSGANAYQTFVGLNSMNLLTDDQLKEWRKIIGLRNTLVHDYLSVDQSIVKIVIKEQKYHSLFDFCELAISNIK
jgi:uncharacterized protein YutE (UPF0331/DUF86 family)